MTDPPWRATMEVLQECRLPPTCYHRHEAHDAGVAADGEQLSVAHGNCGASCHGLCQAWLRRCGRSFGDVETASMFAQLGYELVDKRGLKRFEIARLCPVGNGGYSRGPGTLQAARRSSSAARSEAADRAEISTYVGVQLRWHLNLESPRDGRWARRRASARPRTASRFAQRARFGLVTDMHHGPTFSWSGPCAG